MSEGAWLLLEDLQVWSGSGSVPSGPSRDDCRCCSPPAARCCEGRYRSDSEGAGPEGTGVSVPDGSTGEGFWCCSGSGDDLVLL